MLKSIVDRPRLIIVSMVFMMLWSSRVMAHTGHNHSHWSADWLHYGFYISLVTMIAIVMHGIVRLLTSDRVSR